MRQLRKLKKMNLDISSEKLANPLLTRLLRHVHNTFAKTGYDFFVIGATARDMILHVLSDESARRKTRDLDIAIAVTGWKKYEEISKAMIEAGFEKSKYHTQRFYYGNYEIDVVPFGSVAKDDEKIYWPPEETIAMSVKGFDEVLRHAVTVRIDNEFDIRIVSLHGLFIMKLNAWLDRNQTTNKDAEDIWYIIDTYYFANEYRDFHPEVYELDDFSLTVGGAYWMAHDIAGILSREHLRYYCDLLCDEVMQEENSRLIIQILESHRSVTMKDVVDSFNTIIKVWKKWIGIM